MSEPAPRQLRASSRSDLAELVPYLVGFEPRDSLVVLVNDTLNAINAANVTVAFPATTAQGGTVTLAANTGAFTYTPAAGFTGTDTFTYTLSNGFASASATVNFDTG